MTDVKKLIQEIEKRPCLWDFTDTDYNDKDVKQKNWLEIATMVTPNWDSLPTSEKGVALLQIRKRWKTVRDYYKKEKRSQEKEETDGVQRTKRKKYIHFDILGFLDKTAKERSSIIFTTTPGGHFRDSINSTEQSYEQNPLFYHFKKDPSTEEENSVLLSDNEQTERNEQSENENVLFLPLFENKKRKLKRSNKNHKRENSTLHSMMRNPFQEEVVKIMAAIRSYEQGEDIDEDKSFLLSLLPTMKKLSEIEKLDFKISIMSELKRIQKNVSRDAESNEEHPDFNKTSTAPSSLELKNETVVHEECYIPETILSEKDCTTVAEKKYETSENTFFIKIEKPDYI